MNPSLIYLDEEQVEEQVDNEVGNGSALNVSNFDRVFEDGQENKGSEEEHGEGEKEEMVT